MRRPFVWHVKRTTAAIIIVINRNHHRRPTNEDATNIALHRTRSTHSHTHKYTEHFVAHRRRRPHRSPSMHVCGTLRIYFASVQFELNFLLVQQLRVQFSQLLCVSVVSNAWSVSPGATSKRTRTQNFWEDWSPQFGVWCMCVRVCVRRLSGRIQTVECIFISRSSFILFIYLFIHNFPISIFIDNNNNKNKKVKSKSTSWKKRNFVVHMRMSPSPSSPSQYQR